MRTPAIPLPTMTSLGFFIGAPPWAIALQNMGALDVRLYALQCNDRASDEMLVCFVYGYRSAHPGSAVGQNRAVPEAFAPCWGAVPAPGASQGASAPWRRTYRERKRKARTVCTVRAL
ncbi:hypothetical protein GCM10027032_12110 [Simplicispira piscis]